MEEIIVKPLCGSIECNFEQAKEMLNNQLAIYSGMIFTEETKIEAKKTVADLNKAKKEFNDRVRKVKDEYNAPLDDFLLKAKELSALFDKPISFINEQISDFEAKRIEEKKVLIRSCYMEEIPEEDLQTILPLERIWNPRWVNSTFTAKQIREEILNKKIEVRNALQIIKDMNSEIYEDAERLYLSNFDLPAAIAKVTNYEKQKAEILERERERKRMEEEDRIRREEQMRMKAETEKQAEIQRAKEETKEQIKEEVKEEVISAFTPNESFEDEVKAYSYTIFLNEDGKAKLEMFMDSVGIEYYSREI